MANLCWCQQKFLWKSLFPQFLTKVFGWYEPNYLKNLVKFKKTVRIQTKSRGAGTITTAQLYSTKSELQICGSAQTQILLAACRRFAMFGIFDNGPAKNKAKRLSSVKHSAKKKKINKTTSIHHFRLKYILPALLKPFELIKTSETKNKFYTQLKNEKWPNMLQKTFGMNKARSLQHNWPFFIIINNKLTIPATKMTTV